ncbi:MAG TPA: winged helix-turn-helix domain-containing protein [Gaiellaceae bacterium]|nr:winged helix-turn-helix domain-containing protein [Gaiellaceae bacterium]
MAAEHDWAFITSHAAILIEVRRNPEATVRELADGAGLTERQAHRVLGDLVDAGYIERTRVGRRNQYRINSSQPMRHRSVRHHRVDDLLAALSPR